MSDQFGIPNHNDPGVTDGSLIKVPGPDESYIGYQYDEQTRAFYTRETSLIFSGKHGGTHITTDPIPLATCTTPGMMSADDKCRLDTIVGTRIVVLGFQGAGFPDDGGFLQGDIVLAAGSEMISLERVGNVIRFVVDVPAVFTCGNEDCVQIYWVQDETDTASIRPPINGGKLAGVNAYGELKIYLFPESMVVSPANPAATLNKKDLYPSLVFKRYDDGIGTNEGELDVVLKRNTSGTSIVGWAFTPGATGKPECQFFLGTDNNNNRISFKLDGNSTPGMLGAVLYNGHVITKRQAIITGYDPSVVSTHIYNAKWWDTHNRVMIGDEFQITNRFQWNVNNDSPIIDEGVDTLLPVGQIVDVWSFKIGEYQGSPAYAHYCREQPPVNTSGLWTTIGAIEFGNSLTTEMNAAIVDDLKLIERDKWGVTGLDKIALLNGNTSIEVDTSYGATIDRANGVLSVDSPGGHDDKLRPVTIWNRMNLRDAYLELHLARPVGLPPTLPPFPPIDILLRAPIDAFDTVYATVNSSGNVTGGPYNGSKYISIRGTQVRLLPPRGIYRVLSGSTASIGSYKAIAMGSSDGTSNIITDDASVPANGSLLEFIHEEYNAPAIRLQYSYSTTISGAIHDIAMQPMVGTLDTSLPYGASDGLVNDLAHDFMPGYAVGMKYWQDGHAVDSTSSIISYPDGFAIYDGGGDVSNENFNILKVMVLDYQVWMWWNDMLLPPSPVDSGQLPSPVDINTPYFPIYDVVQYGKFGVRLWPGAKLRRFIVRSRPVKFSQYSLGQLTVG